MKPISLKGKAINYRKQGYSYGMISEKLGLAKSTLSDWLREIPYEPNKEVLKRIKLGPIKSARIRHNQKVATIKKIKKKAKKELGKLTKRDLWLLGIGLYLGDGSKAQESVQLTNSDPEIIKLAARWFREICGSNTKNLTISIHAYPDNDIKNAINYWSRIAGIPKSQFKKTQIDKRINKTGKGKTKLPHGTVRLTVRARDKRELGVNLHRRIMGWIEGVLEQTTG